MPCFGQILSYTSSDLHERAVAAAPGREDGGGSLKREGVFTMAIIPMKALLESGVHFGHRTHKWHPKMKPYIFTERNSIHIIDLQKTVKALETAYNLVRDTVAEDGTVLFVGTKRQAQETIQNEATRCEMPYVTTRWLGGMLTNWRTIRQRINELDRLERMRDRGDFERITKKEALILSRQIERLEVLLGGIRNMVGLPNLLFVVDVRREATAIHEANLLEIPVVAMVDTNCDPRNIDYVVPSNDDAIRAIKLLVGKIADAVLEGKAMRKEQPEEEGAQAMSAEVSAEEPELSDEELLGEATLAKISRTATAEEVSEESAEDDSEEEKSAEATGEVTDEKADESTDEEAGEATDEEADETTDEEVDEATGEEVDETTSEEADETTSEEADETTSEEADIDEDEDEE
jgi:small subunit ribosomal protein S2